MSQPLFTHSNQKKLYSRITLIYILDMIFNYLYSSCRYKKFVVKGRLMMYSKKLTGYTNHDILIKTSQVVTKPRHV